MPRLSLAILLSLITTLARGDDWSGYLGDNRDSVWREDGILSEFPPSGPKLRWSAKVGGGYSGPAVAEGKVFLMDWIAAPTDGPYKNVNEGSIPQNTNFVRERRPGTERIHCFREANGELLWKQEYPCHYTSASTYAIGPRCTPTVDGEFVYTFGAEGHLTCLRTNNGEVVWKKDFVDEYKLKVPEWGTAAAPLVDGERLICIVGGPNATCVAFDKRTGKELWRALDARQPGYCAPVIYEFGGQRQLIVWDSDAVSALKPETGELIWSLPFEATFAMTIGTPRREGNRLFVMCFNRMSAAIDVAEDGKSANMAWTGDAKTGIGGVLNTPFLMDGHIYACGNGGRYTCARLEDGAHVWSSFEPTSGKRPVAWGEAFTIRHQDRFFLANDFGDLILASLSPKGYEEISRAHLIDPTHKVGGRTLVWSHPAFANRSVYVRNDQELRCYSLAADQ
ncbi:MAG: PQQ-binding-like beta-propeller repeat protein [Planctomycetota bacterium]